MAKKIIVQNTKFNLKKVLIFWLPIVIWTIVIFLFSARPTVSTSEIIWQDFIVKKTAHVIEYAILAMLLYRALINSNVPKKEAGIYSIILAILYGASDEFHQFFTPGREPRVRDLFFDALGSILSIYLITKYLVKAPQKIKELAKKFQLI